MAAPTQETVTDILTRHLALITAPIPFPVLSHLATVHMLNRCANLQVDLLEQLLAKDFPNQLFAQLQGISKQRDTPALTLQLQLASLVQEAIKP
jgi:hypothetical protein